MKHPLLPYLWSTIACSSALSYGFSKPQQALPLHAHIRLENAQKQPIGTIQLTEAAVDGTKGVWLDIDAHALPPGPHGMHFHDVGKCDAPEFKSAGPHFNPHKKSHGLNNTEGAHAGDLPNLLVSAEGTAKIKIFSPRVTLSPAPESLLRQGGISIILHKGEDDQSTDPSGNSGDRIACGIIMAGKLK